MKRILLSTLLMGMSASAFASLKELDSQKGPFRLPPLPYPENALEKVIDADTMKIHHSRHHQAYIDNLNKALAGESAELHALLATASSRGDAIRNNAGGHWNHSFFWKILTPVAEQQKMSPAFQKELEGAFGSLEKFKEAFEKQGAGQFGSGWVWLIRNAQGKLEIVATPNQDNPLMDVAAKKGTPILGADVWEHAYYLKYQNKRADYLKNFWAVVNWKQVEEFDQEAKKATQRS